jgi:hypothetical protein
MPLTTLAFFLMANAEANLGWILSFALRLV